MPTPSCSSPAWRLVSGWSMLVPEIVTICCEYVWPLTGLVTVEIGAETSYLKVVVE